MSTAELFSKLVPINSLGPDSIKQLLASTPIENVSSGTELFEQGDEDKDAIYLLEGEVQLTGQTGSKRTIVGGQEDAKYALAQLKPRQYTGKTKSKAVIVVVPEVAIEPKPNTIVVDSKHSLFRILSFFNFQFINTRPISKFRRNFS